MAEAGRFEPWVVSSFNLVALSVVGITAAHVGGALEGELAGFGTLPGVAVFVYLWLLTAGATRWALAGRGLAGLRDGLGGLRSLLVRGVAAGALIGTAFLLGVLVVSFLVSLAQNGLQLLSMALIALIGCAVAGVVGGLIGGLSVVLDAGGYWAAGKIVDRWVDPNRSARPAGDE
ncbi:hypothetical protein ACFQFH_08785 [Halobaculum halobium]|uniref:DUF7965 domain-containing protein n=1 Tax=Halobaculum halobium TaxID=3032281 RepID=A0ABD5T9C3_9EURY|nr:hypothetical protein [Halobaculum sp. SYNS20]